MHRGNLAVQRYVLLGAIALLPLAGCDSTDPGDDARIAIELTDAPSDIVESVDIWISRVYLQGGPNDDDQDDEDGDTPQGRRYLFDDPENPFQVDLIVLQNGATANLSAPVDIPPGDYRGLRIVLDSAVVTLAAGFDFAGGGNSRILKTPSAGTSGLKVQLSGPIAAEEGALTTLLLDFDVDQSFVIQGQEPPPAGGTVQGILLLPVIREVDREVDEAG